MVIIWMEKRSLSLPHLPFFTEGEARRPRMWTTLPSFSHTRRPLHHHHPFVCVGAAKSETHGESGDVTRPICNCQVKEKKTLAIWNKSRPELLCANGFFFSFLGVAGGQQLGQEGGARLYADIWNKHGAEKENRTSFDDNVFPTLALSN